MNPIRLFITSVQQALNPAPKIAHEQVKLVFEQLRSNTVVTAVIALFFCFILLSETNVLLVFSWLACISASLLLRNYFIRKFMCETAEQRINNHSSWVFKLVLTTTLTGIIWGTSSSFILLSGTLHSTFLIILLGMLSVSSIPFLAQFYGAFIGYFLTITTPVFLIIFVKFTPNPFAVTGMFLLFVFSITRSALSFNKTVTDKLTLSLESLEFTKKLKNSNDSLLASLESHKSTQHQLMQNEQYLKAILDNAPVEIYLKDNKGRYILVSRQFEKIFSVTNSEVRGKLPSDVHDPELSKTTRKHDLDVMNTGQTIVREESARLPGINDNKIHTPLTVKFPLKDDNGNSLGIGAVVTDITTQKDIENELRVSQERFRDFAQTAVDYYWEIGAEKQMRFSSSRDGFLNGVPINSIISTSALSYPEGLIEEPAGWGLYQNNLKNYNPYEIEFSFKSKSGRTSRIYAKALPIFVNNVFNGYRGVARDITAEYKLTRHVEYQARHDYLTGLFNRRYFLRILEEKISELSESASSHALCYIDLDHFKIVNDTAGHTAGDALLAEVAEILGRKLGKNDILGRLGGDEFGVIISDCTTNIATKIASRIIRNLQSNHFVWEDQVFQLSTCVGITMINSPEQNPAQLLLEADQSCYKAKESGDGQIYVNERQQRTTNTIQRSRHTDWVDAFNKSKIELYAQPICELGENSWKHPWVEILIRLIDENGIAHSPELFIPYAERNGQIAKIDHWVIQHTLDHIEGSPHLEECKFSINLSAASLTSDTLCDYILDRLRHSTFSSTNLCFELTETSTIKNWSVARSFIQRIREEGCAIALDDFGTGLSSFAYLKSFPVDYIKIDGNFIRDITTDKYNAIFVESICNVAGALNIKTIAESVESIDDLELLTKCGVDFVQGYAMGEPAPLKNICNNPDSLPACFIGK